MNARGTVRIQPASNFHLMSLVSEIARVIGHLKSIARKSGNRFAQWRRDVSDASHPGTSRGSNAAPLASSFKLD